MAERYDVVIVGAGPGGIFAALELSRSSGLRVLIVEKGHALSRRSCPGRERGCSGCKVCAIMTGWGGAGAFSDGKLTLSTHVGGWLGDYIGQDALAKLIDYTDSVWRRHGAPDVTFGPDPDAEADLVRQASLAEMQLVPMQIRHLGTDRSPDVLEDMHDHLVTSGVDIRLDAQVTRILADGGHVTGVELDGEQVRAEAVIAAPGREGAEWLASQARALGVRLTNNAVDIGVRVEVPAAVMEPLTEPLYEAKLIYYSKLFGDQVRTFCMNPYGEVTTESYGDAITVNGHSYAEKRLPNTNFAALVSQSFTHPFHEPITYGMSVAQLANLLSDGNVLVQRLGDLRSGHRSTEDRLRQSVLTPSLPSATPGDLSFVLPYRHLTDIVEFLDAMDRLVPGVASPHTLLYGVEVKFYSSRLELDEDLMTQVSGLYAVGDGAGVTRGLIQSSASGVLAARAILRSLGR